MPENDSKTEETVDLEALAEDVRSRLHQHGQHGALAVFGKYTAAVQERLAAVPTSALADAIAAPPAIATKGSSKKPAAKKTKASK